MLRFAALGNRLLNVSPSTPFNGSLAARTARGIQDNDDSFLSIHDNLGIVLVFSRKRVIKWSVFLFAQLDQTGGLADLRSSKEDDIVGF